MGQNDSMTAATPIRIVSIQKNQSSEGQWHRHYRGQFFIVHQGLLVLETQHGRQVMPALKAGWIPPMHKHKGISYGATQAESFYLTPVLSSLLPTYPSVFTPSSLLLEIIQRIKTWRPHQKLQPVQLRLLDVLQDEFKALTAESLYLPMPKEKRLEKLARDFIANPAQNQNVEVWAAQVYMTKRTFTRHFKLQTGLSFSKWSQQMRVMQAIELLAKEHTVTHIAFFLGYESVSAFIKIFTRYTGCTPTGFKKKAQKCL